MKDETIQQAIRDLSNIRRAVERVGLTGQSPVVPKPVWNAHLILQGAAVIGSVFFLLTELLTGGLQTKSVMAVARFPELWSGALSFVAGTALLAIFAVHWFVRVAAIEANENIDEHTSKHFHYVRNMAFASDLALKVVMFSALIIVGKPEWCAPALLLFTGDYLLQARLFTLPDRVSLALGGACFGVGILQAASGDPSMIYALALFSLVGALSIAPMLRLPTSTAAVADREACSA